MGKRFVIHIHSGYGPLHYDLMLAEGKSLATWQLSRSPIDLRMGEDLPAHRLPNHRSAYLNYEGPVSRHRGRVEALDRGEYELLSQEQDRWEIRFNGCKIQGCYELVRCIKPQWVLRRLPES